MSRGLIPLQNSVWCSTTKCSSATMQQCNNANVNHCLLFLHLLIIHHKSVNAMYFVTLTHWKHCITLTCPNNVLKWPKMTQFKAKIILEKISSTKKLMNFAKKSMELSGLCWNSDGFKFFMNCSDPNPLSPKIHFISIFSQLKIQEIRKSTMGYLSMCIDNQPFLELFIIWPFLTWVVVPISLCYLILCPTYTFHWI